MCVIDVHNHTVTPAVIELLEKDGAHFDTELVERNGARFAVIRDSAIRPLHDRMTQAEPRVEDMDRLGVDVQAVSCVPFLMYPDVEAECAAAMARVNNESLAALSETHAGRFSPLASIPLQAPEAAARELEHAAGLGLRGVEIPTGAPGLDLDDPRLAPVWECAEALGMTVCIHPFDATPNGAFARFALGSLAGNLFDTGMAAALLVFGGVLERHPKLRFVLYHGGGAFPALLSRLDKGHSLFPACREKISRRPSEFVPHFSFDTVVFDREWLRHLVRRFGAERVVMGSDYPLPMGADDPVAEVRALGLPEADERAILGGNAAALLGVDVAAVEHTNR